MQEGLTDAQALAALLAAESFLLAVLNLAVSLGQPTQRRQRRLVIPAPALAWCAFAILTVAATGAAAAWWGMYGGGTFRPTHEAAFAGALAIVIVGQPIFAALIALSSGWES
jgi:hypothetical protein